MIVRVLRRWLYVGHRWLGIATCLLCAMWFVSGIVMMYVPYPRLTDEDRLALAIDLDASQIAVSPDAALRAAGLSHAPTQFRLAMLNGAPVYRIVDGVRRLTVAARDGQLILPVDARDALAIVQNARLQADAASVETLARDQWTVAGSFDPHRPLHKVSLGDADGTELYVSSRGGEFVQRTTRRERVWNWLGAVPHWLYPTVLRQDGNAWRQVVLWTAGPATLGAVAGLWVGILRLRTRRRYSGHRVSPYRGWAKWHHLAGLIAGVFLTTWLASGWLSINPFGWFSRAQANAEHLRDYQGAQGPVFSDDVAVLRHVATSGTRELALQWFDGEPLVVASDSAGERHVFDARSGDPVALETDRIAAVARKLMPAAALLALDRLRDEDAYWYSHHTHRRLPVLRARFGDAQETWFHIDPATGDVLGRLDRSGRAYRWLFNAVHDFDLAMLLRHRPLWDIVVWALSLGGLIISVSGIVIGWRRLGRKLAA